jgi:hypothetical protein
MSVLKKLTEGIVDRDLSKEGAALLSKWERTGLLEGLDNDRTKQSMARLLENQAKELLRETSAMAGGDVEGFAAVAFPIVRRVFGGLVANDLVSVQPMSLPSGLIFFLDFTVSDETGARGGYESGDSIYGGGKVAAEITGGVSLSGDEAEDSFYNLNNGYSSPTGSAAVTIQGVASGTFGGSGYKTTQWNAQTNLNKLGAIMSGALGDQLCRFDPEFTSGTTNVMIGRIALASLSQINKRNWVTVSASLGLGSGVQLNRRLTQLSGSAVNKGIWKPGDAETHLLLFWSSDTRTIAQLSASVQPATYLSPETSWSIDDDFVAGGAKGSVIGDPLWGLEQAAASASEANGRDVIPEIDIKVDSVSITAMTKKLKAKWTPELGQDLNAYHNLDAEVELTSILSEQIALEIDREILADLVNGQTAGKYYWSRAPGRFVRRTGTGAGEEVGVTTATPDFTGTVSEWYETLVETINDVSAQIHRKTLRGGANFIVVGPEVANILEFTAGFRANVTGDVDKGTVGAVKTGALSKKWDVYVDPYFPRNLVLVGRKGGSFLESGYVYAPYVPLQVTPTIFGTEDFVPRKGVMTRYGKKMVRPDMYGLVVVLDLV